jgi:hypothetical protein
MDFLVNEIKWGRTDFNTITSPGRELDEDIAAAVAGKLDIDPQLSTRKFALSLLIPASAVYRYLTEVLGIKCRHLRWVPHMLAPAQKVMHTELAQNNLQTLAKHENTNYHLLFIGDEQWIVYTSDHRTTWVTSWDNVDEIEQPLYFHQKTIFTILVNAQGNT